MEPLATIYGMANPKDTKTMTAHFVTKAFQDKLAKSMTDRLLAVAPKEEAYGKALVKARGHRGKRVPQKNRLEPYYATKYVWLDPLVEPKSPMLSPKGCTLTI